MTKTKNKSISKNAPPPLTPASYGNRHMLPSPTAEPTVVAIAPSRVAKCARFSVIFFEMWFDVYL